MRPVVGVERRAKTNQNDENQDAECAHGSFVTSKLAQRGPPGAFWSPGGRWRTGRCRVIDSRRYYFTQSWSTYM